MSLFRFVALQFFKQVVVIHVLLQVGVADPSLVPIRPALVLMDAQILAEQDGLAVLVIPFGQFV